MDQVKRAFRRLAPTSNSHGLSVPAANGGVTVSFSDSLARFFLSVPMPDASSGAGPYRGDAVPPVPAERPLEIRLRAQTDEDTGHVASGIAREVCTGDAEFDEEVYIDTECPEETVLAVLTQGARAALLSLVQLGRGRLRLDAVTIDDKRGRIIVEWSAIPRVPPELSPEEAQSMVTAVDALRAALPAVRSTGTRTRRRGVGVLFPATNWLALLLFPVALYTFGTGRRSAELMVWGLLSGAAVGACLIVLAHLFIRGRSDSPEIRGRAMGAAFWLPMELGVIIARLLS